MVTLVAALQDHIATADTTYDSRRDGHRQRAGDQREEALLRQDHPEQAMWYSSNTVFGQVGVQLGSDLIVQMAAASASTKTSTSSCPLATSLMPDP
ncbi:MAG: hypothetical protein ACLTSX_13140 [Collinsella sp.]